MQVLPLLQQHCVPLNFKLGRELGNGSNGQVFGLLDDDNKVIKLGIIYDHPGQDLDAYRTVQTILDHAMLSKSDVYVRVYEHGYLGTFTRLLHNKPQAFVIYYYVMEKLLEISEDERKVFHSILSHEDRNICKDFSANKINKMLLGMAQGLDFDAEKIKLFCQKIKRSSIKHSDLHPRNILKNSDDEFKLIDLDNCQLL